MQSRNASCLRISDFTRHVILVDTRLLEEHVEAAFVLRQRVTCDPVSETTNFWVMSCSGKIGL